MKSTLATILGLAGLSLLKINSGSSNNSMDLPDKLGFLWFEVSFSDKGQGDDFNVYHFARLLRNSKMFAVEHKGMSADDMFRHHGGYEDEDGGLVFPDGIPYQISLVLETVFDPYFATGIMGQYSEGYFENENILENFLFDASCIQQNKIPIFDDGEKPNKVFVEVNIMNLASNNRYLVRSLSDLVYAVKKLINEFLYIYTITARCEEKDITIAADPFEDWESITSVHEDDFPVEFSLSLVRPKDPRMLTSILIDNSELRKF